MSGFLIEQSKPNVRFNCRTHNFLHYGKENEKENAC